MNAVKDFHDQFYTANILDLDEQGNDFKKIESLWTDASEPKKVLDIGCGAGTVTSELVRRGHCVYGIDIQDEAVRRASGGGLQARVWDLNRPLPFEDKFFDVIVAADVIEHLFEPLGLLCEIRRILKDDGYAILGIPRL